MLHGREQLVQPFVATYALPLYRINVEASPSHCTALRFHWAIDEIDAKGQRRTRAQGEYAFDDRADPTFAGWSSRPSRRPRPEPARITDRRGRRASPPARAAVSAAIRSRAALGRHTRWAFVDYVL